MRRKEKSAKCWSCTHRLEPDNGEQESISTKLPLKSLAEKWNNNEVEDPVGTAEDKQKRTYVKQKLVKQKQS